MVDNNSDDPFALPEGTILRPRPGGAGRRIVAQPGTAAQPASRPAAAGVSFPSQGFPPPGTGIVEGPATYGAGASLDDFVTGTDNPILQSAAPLLLLVARLGAVQHVTSTSLRQQAVQEKIGRAHV